MASHQCSIFSAYLILLICPVKNGGITVSAHSLYKWLRAIKPDNSEQYARGILEAKSEILKLRAQLKRTEEEWDILKKAARYFAREPD